MRQKEPRTTEQPVSCRIKHTWWDRFAEMGWRIAFAIIVAIILALGTAVGAFEQIAEWILGALAT